MSGCVRAFLHVCREFLHEQVSLSIQKAKAFPPQLVDFRSYSLRSRGDRLMAERAHIAGVVEIQRFRW
jgi:hypothetical protein